MGDREIGPQSRVPGRRLERLLCIEDGDIQLASLGRADARLP